MRKDGKKDGKGMGGEERDEIKEAKKDRKDFRGVGGEKQAEKPKGMDKEGKCSGMLPIIKPLDWKDIPYKHADVNGIKGEFGEEIVREFVGRMGFTLKRQQSRAPGLPDFRVEGTQAFIEVKSHETGPNAKPPVWQKRRFFSMAKMGWKIFIAHPKIELDEKERTVACASIGWYEFGEDGKLERIWGFPSPLNV